MWDPKGKEIEDERIKSHILYDETGVSFALYLETNGSKRTVFISTPSSSLSITLSMPFSRNAHLLILVSLQKSPRRKVKVKLKRAHGDIRFLEVILVKRSPR